MKDNFLYKKAIILKSFLKIGYAGPIDYDSNFINYDLNNDYKSKFSVFISLLYFSLKSIFFSFSHLFLITSRFKSVTKKLIFLTPDFYYDKEKGFTNYWRSIQDHKKVDKDHFYYFSNYKDRINIFKKRKNCIDGSISFYSLILLICNTIQYNLFLYILFLTLLFKKEVFYLTDFIKLSYINDIFLYYLCRDFNYKLKDKSDVFFVSEFQNWEFGLTSSKSINYYAYQHSGVRFNDLRIKKFNNNVSVKYLVHFNEEYEYLKKILKEDKILIVENIRNSFLKIYSAKKSKNFIFFGSTNLDYDNEVIKLLNEQKIDFQYKMHPSYENKNNIHFNLNKFTPIINSNSASTIEMYFSSTPFLLIFRNDFKDSLLFIKQKIIENIDAVIKMNSNYSCIFFDLKDINPKFYITSSWSQIIKL